MKLLHLSRAALLLCSVIAFVACSSSAEVQSGDVSIDGSGVFGDVTPLDAISPQPDAGEPTGPGDTQSTDSADGGPSTHGFGWPCLSDEECHSGYCLQPDNGDTGFCSQLCQQDCPNGYLCQNQPAYGPVVFLCVPLTKVGCEKPCFHPWTFQGCGVPGALCALVGEDSMCLDACSADQDCPDDFSCTELADEGGFTLGKQCFPDSGSCLCGSSVDTETDPQHCGECGSPCEYENAQPTCVAGQCEMGTCESGWFDLDGLSENGCEYLCEPEEGLDLPDPDNIDLNCDGIDGELGQAVFVEPGGIDLNNSDGTRDYPFQTIHAALSFASQESGRTMVLAAAGTYKGMLALVSGIHVAGGYEAGSWTRDATLHSTIVFNDAPGPSGAIRAVTADMIVEDTRVTGLVIRTSNNPVSGGVIQAMWVRNSGAVLEISDNIFEPGDGGVGMAGLDGMDGFAAWMVA